MSKFKVLRRRFKRIAKLLLTRPRDMLWFIGCWREWQAKSSTASQAPVADWYICLDDRRAAAGIARGHYFLQDLWAAQRVFAFQSRCHVDVGSTVNGFVSHVAAFRPVEYVDIRPLECRAPNLSFRQGSIIDLPYADHSVESLSSLHVIEHIGLGRYGDPLDPEGWLRAVGELERVLAPGGQLLIGTPCGQPKVHFNAHRVFDPNQIVAALPGLRLLEFSLIESDEATEWRDDHPLTLDQAVSYGCGLFRFTRD